MTKEDSVKKAQKLTDQFLDALGVSARAKIFEVEEYLKIEIEGKDASLLIGYHGDNLRALKHLLSIYLRKNLPEGTIITIDVSGYLEKKEERIKEISNKAIRELEKTGKPQDLPEMSPYERRIAHSHLTEMGYISDSVGDGRNRHVVVKK